ncbi:hypothetical protein Q6A64_01135 [Helicobacter pylori]|nr:hypothetical protein [Helicobacter pylori]
MVKICFKFRYNRSFNVFLVFLSFWHGLFLLVVVWAFQTPPLFLSDRII